MTPQGAPAATGPQILAAVERVEAMLAKREGIQLAATAIDRLLQIEDRMAQLVERMERIERVAQQRHRVADARAERVDKFVLDDAFNLDATNKQLIEVFNALRGEVLDLKALLKREHDTTRKAVALQLGSEGLAAERHDGPSEAPTTRVRPTRPSDWRG